MLKDDKVLISISVEYLIKVIDKMLQSSMLQWISNFQHEMGNTVWLDSGTLLGLVRDQRILAWDKDIDLGMWDQDLKTFKSIIKNSKLFDETTKFQYKNYASEVYHISINNNSWKIPVHINVYRKSHDHAYCAQGHSKINTYRGMKKKLLKVVRKVFTKFFTDRYTWNNTWLINKTYDVYTWWIPQCYFCKLTDIQVHDMDFIVPHYYKEYLQARYGDWLVPNDHWNYWEDDNCIVQLPPEKVLCQIK